MFDERDVGGWRERNEQMRIRGELRVGEECERERVPGRRGRGRARRRRPRVTRARSFLFVRLHFPSTFALCPPNSSHAQN
jgi:hypothetical protein